VLMIFLSVHLVMGPTRPLPCIYETCAPHSYWHMAPAPPTPKGQNGGFCFWVPRLPVRIPRFSKPSVMRWVFKSVPFHCASPAWASLSLWFTATSTFSKPRFLPSGLQVWARHRCCKPCVSVQFQGITRHKWFGVQFAALMGRRDAAYSPKHQVR
jgi:hypothetical protein